MSYQYTILVWNKSDLPSNWNGAYPVHVKPTEEIIDAEDLNEARQAIAQARIRFTEEKKHYHIIKDGELIFSSSSIRNY